MMETEIVNEILEMFYEYEERKKARRIKFWDLFKL